MYGAVGTGGNIIVPILDSYFDGHNNLNSKKPDNPNMVRKVAVESMISA